MPLSTETSADHPDDLLSDVADVFANLRADMAAKYPEMFPKRVSKSPADYKVTRRYCIRTGETNVYKYKPCTPQGPDRRRKENRG
jgi:hypothetical protein